MNMKEGHKERTGFTVPSGHYEFKKLPFGLANSPSKFQRPIDAVLKYLIGKECWVYMDYVVVFSKNGAKHERLL